MIEILSSRKHQETCYPSFRTAFLDFCGNPSLHSWELPNASRTLLEGLWDGETRMISSNWYRMILSSFHLTRLTCATSPARTFPRVASAPRPLPCQHSATPRFCLSGLSLKPQEQVPLHWASRRDRSNTPTAGDLQAALHTL